MPIEYPPRPSQQPPIPAPAPVPTPVPAPPPDGAATVARGADDVPSPGQAPGTGHRAAAPAKGRRRWLVPVLALGVLGLGLGILAFVESSGEDATDVVLEAAGAAVEDPFVSDPSVAATGRTVSATSEYVAPNADLDALDVLLVTGDEAGLYGGTGNEETCNTAALAAHLAARPDLEVAFARAVPGLTPNAVGPFIENLTTVQLMHDTRLTRFGLVDGEAVPRQVISQAGTAVMIDQAGMPRVHCGSGSPLGPPEPTERTVVVPPTGSGRPWPSFHPAAVVTVQEGRRPSVFVLTNVDDGTVIERSAVFGAASDELIDDPAPVIGGTANALRDSIVKADPATAFDEILIKADPAAAFGATDAAPVALSSTGSTSEFGRVCADLFDDPTSQPGSDLVIPACWSDVVIDGHAVHRAVVWHEHGTPTGSPVGAFPGTYRRNEVSGLDVVEFPIGVYTATVSTDGGYDLAREVGFDLFDAAARSGLVPRGDQPVSTNDRSDPAASSQTGRDIGSDPSPDDLRALCAAVLGDSHVEIYDSGFYGCYVDSENRFGDGGQEIAHVPDSLLSTLEPIPVATAIPGAQAYRDPYGEVVVTFAIGPYLAWGKSADGNVAVAVEEAELVHGGAQALGYVP